MPCIDLRWCRLDPESCPCQWAFRRKSVDDVEHGVCVMDVSCIGYLLAQILKFFLSGLSDGLLLCTLEHLVSAAVMPGLHHHGHGHFTCLCKVPQLPFEVPLVSWTTERFA